MTPIIHDVNSTLLPNVENSAVKFTQHISDDLLTGLANSRAESSAPAGDFLKVCSVPVAICEKWLREGFDIYREDARAIVVRLKAEDLSAFMATNKRI